MVCNELEEKINDFVNVFSVLHQIMYTQRWGFVGFEEGSGGDCSRNTFHAEHDAINSFLQARLTIEYWKNVILCNQMDTWIESSAFYLIT